MKKKKKKDKDGSNTIVFEIREYRFRTDYDTFWLRECSGYGCMVRVYQPVTSRISAVPAFSPLPSLVERLFEDLSRANTLPVANSFLLFRRNSMERMDTEKTLPLSGGKNFSPAVR